MASNAAAYKEAYADKPIDVAGAHVKAASDVVDFAIQEQKIQEKEAKDRKAANSKLYGDAVANVIDTTDGPPDAQQVSTQIGDRIAYLVQDSGLEGIELQNAINNTLKTGNAAITDINTRFAEHQADKNAPKNRYLNLNGQQDEVEEFNNGNRTMQWDPKTGKALWVGVDKNGRATQMPIGRATKDAEDTPDYSIPTDAAVEQITTNYGSNPTTPRFRDNVQNIETDLTSSVSHSIQTYHQVGNAAAAIKKNDGTDLYSDDELRRLNEVGARLEQDPNTVSKEDKDFFNSMKQEVVDFKVNQIGSSIYGASAWGRRNEKPVEDPNAGSGGGGSNKVPTETKNYIKSTTNVLDSKDGVGYDEAVRLTKLITESSSTSDFKEWKDAGYDVEVDYETEGENKNRTGKGVLNINGEEVPFSSWEDMKSKLRGVVLGDRQETVEKFSDTINLVKGDNFGQIATDLGIKFRGQNYGFTPINGGVQVTKGTKTLDIPLDGLSLTRRKQRIQTILDNL